MDGRDIGEKSGTCQICQRTKNISDPVPARDLGALLLETIRKNYPAWSVDGYICMDDLSRLRAQYITITLSEMRKGLDELHQKVSDRFKKFEQKSKTMKDDSQQRTTGQKVADTVASFGGSWRFISIFMTFLLFWVILNTFLLTRKPFDPYPFILLNLILSCIAALQAPVIMMSQNRLEARDRRRAQRDLLVDLKAEMEIRNLNDKMDLLMSQQWLKLLEIQQLQIELIAELPQKTRT